MTIYKAVSLDRKIGLIDFTIDYVIWDYIDEPMKIHKSTPYFNNEGDMYFIVRGRRYYINDFKLIDSIIKNNKNRLIFMKWQKLN